MIVAVQGGTVVRLHLQTALILPVLYDTEVIGESPTHVYNDVVLTALVSVK
jgi:hypothetical protein